MNRKSDFTMICIPHFSRILHELATSDLIEVNGRAVRIPDLERLRRGA